MVDQDQPVSEEQNYRDTIQGICSYMIWSHIPEVDNTTATSDDNPFAGPKTVTPGKVSVKMPTEEWLCKKLGKLNLTLAEGYPSRGSEAADLAKDVFLRPAHSQSKWYGLHTDQKTDPSKVLTWHTNAASRTVVTAALPDKLDLVLLLQLPAESLKRHYADGRGRPERPQPYAIRPPVLIAVCLEFSKI